MRAREPSCQLYLGPERGRLGDTFFIWIVKQRVRLKLNPTRKE